MQVTDWAGRKAPALGMGCWAIGGPFSMDGRSVGWGETDDDVSRATISAAYDAGLRVFDSAQAYGTGHSEALLGEVLGDKPDALVVTKIGLGIDPSRRVLTGPITEPSAIQASLEASRTRLRRDRIDLVLLHLNDLEIAEAAPIFDLLDQLIGAGWVGAYGWSTDFPDRVTAFADRSGFTVIEHAMNLFFAAEKVTNALSATDLVPLIRSPLAMGLLGGRIDATTTLPQNDVRGQDEDWVSYFKDGRANPDHLARLDAVRECLTSGGRSLAQGALAWLWARNPRCLPVPGMRTPEQVADLVGALEFGALDASTTETIEQLMKRPDEGEPRPR